MTLKKIRPWVLIFFFFTFRTTKKYFRIFLLLFSHPPPYLLAPSRFLPENSVWPLSPHSMGERGGRRGGGGWLRPQALTPPLPPLVGIL
jgi:hypothetical protein